MLNDIHTITQKRFNQQWFLYSLNYHHAGSFFRTEVGNRAYGSRHTNKNPKVKKVMCIASEYQLFFFV